MPYTTEISRASPSCFLFVIDQSGSMGDPFSGTGTGRSKAQELADVINRQIRRVSAVTVRRSKTPLLIGLLAGGTAGVIAWRRLDEVQNDDPNPSSWVIGFIIGGRIGAAIGGTVKRATETLIYEVANRQTAYLDRGGQ